MIDLSIKIKTTSELSEKEIKALISLKQQHWDYSDERQMKWFAENIVTTDYHLMIYRHGKLLSYMNIVNVSLVLNDQKTIEALGIGNVCVDKANEHLGLGALLLASVNSFIKKSKTCGVLLCRERLAGFYEKSGWKIYCGRVSVVGNPFQGILMMLDPFELMPKSIDSINTLRSF